MTALGTGLVSWREQAPAVAAVLRRGRDQPALVVSLTDEELLCLDGDRPPTAAPTPWLDGLSRHERTVAAKAALRSLAAHDHVLLVPEDGGDVRVTVPPALAAVLAMRRCASAVVVAEQRSGDLRRHRVLHVQGEHGVLEEDVNPGGLHRFTSCTLEAALTALRVWCDPAGAAGPVDEPVRSATLAELAAGGELAQHLAQAVVVTVVGAVTSGGGDAAPDARLSVYGFDSHVAVGVARTDGSRTTDVVPVDAAGLEQRLTALLHP